MDNKVEYRFTTTIWRDKGGWYFAALPVEMSAEIRECYGDLEEGWGRLKAGAEILGIEWDTAVWFDTKSGTYILPVKKLIREKLNSLIGSIEGEFDIKVFI